MKRHYGRIAQKMLIDLEDSKTLDHAGEQGRNNERILEGFLAKYLAQRYTVSTGKVIAATGALSDQIDLIVHDRLSTPQISIDEASALVPVESVYAVISVKTSLDKSQLRDAMSGIKSVRRLPRKAAIHQSPSQRIIEIPEEKVLRPRALVFAFQSNWSTAKSADKAFRDLLDEEEFEDEVRPNGICILDQCFIHRKPFATNTHVFTEYPLMHFFMFLSRALDTFPKWQVDLNQYFEAYEPGQSVPLHSSPAPDLG